MKRIYQYHVDVTRVIDGDTFVGTVDLGMDTYIRKIRFRMLGIDTPERGEKGYKEATDFTREMVEGKHILVQSYEKDSFGRWLADVFIDGETETLNDIILKKGLAIVYI